MASFFVVDVGGVISLLRLVAFFVCVTELDVVAVTVGAAGRFAVFRFVAVGFVVVATGGGGVRGVGAGATGAGFGSTLAAFVNSG